MIAGQNVQCVAGRTRRRAAWSTAVLLLATLANGARAETTAPSGAPNTTSAAASGDVERGRYLTQSVAMCVQCHTPRNADGTLDETRLFQGAAVPVESPFPAQEWATQAPAIAGLVSFNADDELSLLTTGHRRDGHMPKPPMPPFRLSQDDARAVIAYLRSLRR
jgi:mono/diheme cytochrome c family protein